MLNDWILSKLEAAKDYPTVIVRDPLSLTRHMHNDLHAWGKEHLFAVIPCATNLQFRWKYEAARSDSSIKKILVIDQAPESRRQSRSLHTASAPFYPDLLARTPEEARIDLDLRQFLKEVTGDPNWPLGVNDPRYARLVVRHLSGVLRAHDNLRAAHAGRFTDRDFRTIVAFAALGVPESAFKKLDTEDYWRIGLMGHEALQELGSLAPEVTGPIGEELRKAPAPFCWFADRDPETVVRAFYLSVVLAQHTKNWGLLLANIDPALAPMSNMDDDILSESASKLVRLHPRQADRDLHAVEQSLGKDALEFVLLNQMRAMEPAGFASVIQEERYSSLVRSLALLLALENLLSTHPARTDHAKVAAVLFPEEGANQSCLADARPSIAWSQLKEAYRLAYDILSIRDKLGPAIKAFAVLKAEKLSFKSFCELWNEKRVNRLEYYLSALERLVYSAELLPRPEAELPSAFEDALSNIRKAVRSIAEEVHRQIDTVNRHFQEMVAAQYTSWIAKDSEVYLTSQFLRRCLKPHWDPQNEKAVVFIFDGMRYDIWDELLRPMLLDRMEQVVELPASSLIPSETHITRKAISAGACPDEFDMRRGEDQLLQDALTREFQYAGSVEMLAPESGGTGEVVRYRAGNLDVYIFEMCDKELHNVAVKTLPDGRQVPARPLAFIYQQHVKSIIDTEVMAIVRSLSPGTKVFVTADHGFSRVARQPLWFKDYDLNEPQDCSYLNCWLRVPFSEADVPHKVRDNVIAFTPQRLRMPCQESRTSQKTGQVIVKQYGAILFPKVGYSFSRPASRYDPDAYSHGGISIQEMLIPMAVLRVRSREEGLIALGAVAGPTEAVEGEEIEFRMRISRTAAGNDSTDELRVDVEATYSRGETHFSLPGQVRYVPLQGTDITYRFRPDTASATEEERRQGAMERALTISVAYRDGHRVLRKSQTRTFLVRLNSEQVIRRVSAHLGNILGLAPKGVG